MTVLQDTTATDEPTEPVPPAQARRSRGRVRRMAMRPRKVIVRLHRWVSIGLVAWVVVISLTGAWLVEHHAIESWLHGSRYRGTSGDVGPDRAVRAAKAAVPKR